MFMLQTINCTIMYVAKYMIVMQINYVTEWLFTV